MTQDAIKVGELRPTQLLWSFGVGSVTDLPHLATIIGGLQDWNQQHCELVNEPRLLSAVRETLGWQVENLRLTPVDPDESASLNPYQGNSGKGVPVYVFPNYYRCPFCNLLAGVDSGLFELKSNPFRPDQARFEHTNCNKSRNPRVYPARFIVACRKGHLDDFPWRYFVHRGPTSCKGRLEFQQRGPSLEAANLWVICQGCTVSDRPLVEAFDRTAGSMPSCRGAHPHLSIFEDGCEEEIRSLVLGASNTWFPTSLTVLSVPVHTDLLAQLVRDHWLTLEHAANEQILDAFRLAGNLEQFSEFSNRQILTAIESERDRLEGSDEGNGAEPDLKMPEWEVFKNPSQYQTGPDFLVTPTFVPSEMNDHVDTVMLAEKLREVTALTGFTRIEPPDEGTTSDLKIRLGPLEPSKSPTWVPTVEVRGEGVFVSFDIEKISHWLARPEVNKREEQLYLGHRLWRTARNLEPNAGFPGAVYIALHTLAHALISEFSVECGYGMASIRERIYASDYGKSLEMAGIMLYTSAPDSEGTLGGLVELGKPNNLGRLMESAIDKAKLCSSDPLCSEHDCTKDATLHGAACHACIFASETSCEKGNKYLDRALLVPTFQPLGSELFD